MPSDFHFDVRRGRTDIDDDFETATGISSDAIIDTISDVRNGTYAHANHEYIDVTDPAWGAKCTAGRIIDGTIAVGTNPNLLLSASVGTHTSEVGPPPTVGMPIWVEGAGPAGAMLQTTVASVVPGVSITLTDAASTSVGPNKRAVWGYDDTAAINAASLYAAAVNVGRILIPGPAVVTAPLLINRFGTIYCGPTRGSTFIFPMASNFGVFKGASATTRYNHCGFEHISVESFIGFTGIKAFDFSRLSSSFADHFSINLRDDNCIGVYVSDAADGTGPYYCTLLEPNISMGAKATNYGIYFGRDPGDAQNRSANSWLISGGKIVSTGVGIYLQGEGHIVDQTRFESISTGGAAIKAGDDTIASSCTGCKIRTNHEGGSGSVAFDISTNASGNTFDWGTHTGLASPSVNDRSGGKNTLPSGGVGITTTTLTSGTAKQISAVSGVFVGFDVTLNPTAGAAATVTVAIGPDNTTANQISVPTRPANAVAGEVQRVFFWLPLGWWVKATAVNATIGTVTYMNR